MTRGGAAWAAVAGLLIACALAGQAVDAAAIDWQPGRAVHEPWRAWSAVAVHYSSRHLVANLVGALVVAAFGLVAEVPGRAAWAWLGAWPLTQLGLGAVPALTHFGGLSGVLHAGVVVVVVGLLARGTPAQRGVGLLVLLGCAAKLVGEAPWQAPPLRHPAGWDIATAPVAHLTGSLAGLACGLVALAGRRAPHHRTHRHA